MLLTAPGDLYYSRDCFTLSREYPPYFCWGGGGAVTWRVRWGKPTDLQLVLLSLAVLHPHLQGYHWLILEHIQAASQLSPVSGPGFHILGSAGPFNTHSFAFSPAKFCCIYYPLSLSLFFKIILYWSFSAMGLGGEEVERKITCMRNYIHCLYPERFNFFLLFLWNYTTFYYLHTGNLLGFLCSSSAKWEKWWYLLYTIVKIKQNTILNCF